MADKMTSGVVIRKAVPQDADGVVHLILSNWEDPTGHISRTLPLEFADMFSNATYRPTFFVADAEGKVIGCSFWNWSWANYDTFEFGWMCVDKSYRRRGIGEALHRVRLSDVVGRVRPSKAHMILLSTRLVERYQRFGFKVICENPNLMRLVIHAPVWVGDDKGLRATDKWASYYGGSWFN